MLQTSLQWCLQLDGLRLPRPVLVNTCNPIGMWTYVMLQCLHISYVILNYIGITSYILNTTMNKGQSYVFHRLEQFLLTI